MAKSYLKGQKTLWEKEKLLATSNFSFSHGVFKGLVLQTRKNKGFSGKGLNMELVNKWQTTNLIFTIMAKSYLKGQKTLWEMEKLLATSNFSFSHGVFKGLVLQTRKNKGFSGKGLNMELVNKWQTTNLVFNIMAKSYLKGQKTLWEKEKLLVASNFSFSHGVFKGLVLQTRKNKGFSGKGLNMELVNKWQTTNLVFNIMAKSYLKGQKTLWEKEKLLVASNFSFSHGVFKGLVLQTRKNKGFSGKGLNMELVNKWCKNNRYSYH